MPHLHSALGYNFSAGMTLTPAAYRDLFAPRHPRLFRDSDLLNDILGHTAIDLSRDVTPEQAGHEPSITLIASRDASRVSRRTRSPTRARSPASCASTRSTASSSTARTATLTLTFPTTEYEEEFGGVRRYLPESLTLDADPRGDAAAGAVRCRLHRPAAPPRAARRPAPLLLSESPPSTIAGEAPAHRASETTDAGFDHEGVEPLVERLARQPWVLLHRQRRTNRDDTVPPRRHGARRACDRRSRPRSQGGSRRRRTRATGRASAAGGRPERSGPGSAMPKRDVTSGAPGSHERNMSGALRAATTGSAQMHPRACRASSSGRRSSSPGIGQNADTTAPGGGANAAR